METDVRSLFYPLIATFAESEIIPVNWPNVPFSPTDESYLKVNMLPTDPQVLTIKNAGSRYVWLLQIAVCCRDGKGEIKIQQIVDKLRALFVAGIKYTGAVRTYVLDSPASSFPSIVTDGWMVVPVQYRVVTIK